MNANSGGLHIGDGVPTTIARTVISESKVVASDPRGEPLAFDAAMLMGAAPLQMRNVRIEGSHLIALAADSKVAGPSGSALEVDGGGTIIGLSLTSNSSEVQSVSGTAQAVGALAILNFNQDAKPTFISRSQIRFNRAVATSATSAVARGAGIVNDSLLVLEGVEVSQNHLRAAAPRGSAQGGGIWSGADISGPPVRLTLRHSTVAENTATGATGVEVLAGGLYSSSKLQLVGSTIEGNSPDDCRGC